MKPSDLFLATELFYHADTTSHSLRRQILAELGSDRTAVSVRPGNLAPDDAQVTRLLVTGTCRLPAHQFNGTSKIGK